MPSSDFRRMSPDLCHSRAVTASLEKPLQREDTARLGVHFHTCGAERRRGVFGVFPFGETNLVVRYTFLETKEDTVWLFFFFSHFLVVLGFSFWHCGWK